MKRLTETVGSLAHFLHGKHDVEICTLFRTEWGQIKWYLNATASYYRTFGSKIRASLARIRLLCCRTDLRKRIFSSIPDVYCTSLPTEVAGAALMTIYCICSAYLLLCVVLCCKDACIIMICSFDEREMKTKTSASDQRLACGWTYSAP